MSGEQFRYTGRRLDPETGLYYYRARYYSPVLGRFLQTDPVGYGPDLDLYTYVGNDPLDKNDPSGFCEPDSCADMAAGIRSAERPPTGSDLKEFALDSAPLTGEFRAGYAFGSNPSFENGAILVASVADLGGVAKGILRNAKEGKTFEKLVRDANGLDKNTTPFKTAHGNTVGEIKGSKRVSDSPQLRAQRDVAATKGETHTVYVKKDAQVSKTVEQRSDVVRCDPITGTVCGK
jgi:RHS repeat-associated protein